MLVLSLVAAMKRREFITLYVPFVGARELDNALVTVGTTRVDAMLVLRWCIGPELPNSRSRSDCPRCTDGANTVKLADS